MKQFKRIAGLLVLIATLAAFAHYVNTHPEMWWQLQDTNPWLLVRLFFLYALTIVVLVFVYDTTRLAIVKWRIEISK